MATHLVYCWELGANFGHVTRIRDVLAQLNKEDYRFSFILKQPNKGRPYLSEYSQTFIQAPFLPLSIGEQASSNFSHILLRCGWSEKPVLKKLLQAWLELFRQLKPEIILLDHAPTAALAAHILKIPFKHIANSFEIPTIASPMPSLLPWLPSDKKQRKQADKLLAENVAWLAKQFAIAGDKQNWLSNIFTANNSLIVGHPVFDHYQGGRQPGVFAQLPQQPQANIQRPAVNLNTSDKSLAFFYLDANFPLSLPCIELLAKDYCVFGFMRNINVVDKTKLQQLGVLVCEQMVELDFAFQQAELIVYHGSAGISKQLALMPKAALLIPTQVEQALVTYWLVKNQLVFSLPSGMSVGDIQRHLIKVKRGSKATQTRLANAITNASQHSFYPGDVASFVSS